MYLIIVLKKFFFSLIISVSTFPISISICFFFKLFIPLRISQKAHEQRPRTGISRFQRKKGLNSTSIEHKVRRIKNIQYFYKHHWPIPDDLLRERFRIADETGQQNEYEVYMTFKKVYNTWGYGPNATENNRHTNLTDLEQDKQEKPEMVNFLGN